MRRSSVLASKLLRAANATTAEATARVAFAHIGASSSSVFLPSQQPLATGHAIRSFASGSDDDDEQLEAYYSGPVM